MTPPKGDPTITAKLAEALGTDVQLIATADDLVTLEDARGNRAQMPEAVTAAFADGDTGAPTRALFQGQVQFSSGTTLDDVLHFGVS